MKKIRNLAIVAVAFIAVLSVSACGQSEIINLQNGPKISAKFDKMLEEYADLIVKSAINIQNGQKVVITSTPQNYYLADKCLDKAFEAGASDVKILWTDQYEDHQRAKYSTKESLSADIMFDYAARDKYTSEHIAYIELASKDPGINNDLTDEQTEKFADAKSVASEGFSNRSGGNEFQWVVASIPQTNWAKKVFPNKSEDEAVTALWSAIFETTYVKGDGGAADRFKEHMKNLQDKAEMMDNYNFKSLHYTNGLGTDLSYELPDNYRWATGLGESTYGVPFCANIPTEEIFCAPKKDSVNGRVYSSRPLILNGVTVENFYFDVKDGKIVDIHAEKGEEALKDEIKNNEGAEYFGEVALVPYDSVISKQNIVYYDTIYDENASCHIAFGAAYPECIKNGLNMTDQQIMEAGLNISTTHVDFMIGTSDLKIVGITKDGKEVVVFENGNWAI